MKKMKMIMVITMVALFAATTAMAATQYTTCAVKRTSTAANGVTQLMLDDTAGTGWTGNKWFAAPTGSDDQTLATGLTAMSLTRGVRIAYDDVAFALISIGLNNN